MIDGLPVFTPWIEKGAKSQSLRNIAIILGILFLAYRLGSHPSHSQIIMLAGMIVAGVDFILLNRQPAWGVLAIIQISFLATTESRPGPTCF